MLALVASALLLPSVMADSCDTPEKVGAGLLLCCDGAVLLMLRTGKHNAGTWGLPGGNMDPEDADLLAAAQREGREELGHLPPFTVQHHLLTRRGKRLQKHYTVFVAEVESPQRQLYTPVVNAAEHSTWSWFDWQQLQQMLAAGELHPVVELLLQHHSDVVKGTLGVS